MFNKVYRRLTRRYSVGTIFGVHIIADISFVLANLLIACFVQQAVGLYPALVSAGCFMLIVIIHEAGHAIAAKLCKCEVFAINLYWYGGSCASQMPKSKRCKIMVFLGGIVAQGVVTAPVALVLLFVPLSPLVYAITQMFVFNNLLVMLLNSIPYGNLDGGQIYRLLRK